MRGNDYQGVLKFLNAKIDGLQKGATVAPHFVISSWSKEEGQKIITDNASFIEGKLTSIELKDGEYEGKKTRSLIFTLEDEERNQIKWRIGYGKTIRTTLYKLSTLDKIDVVRFSTGLFQRDGEREIKFISVKINGENIQNPFDFEKDIKPKRRAVLDSETNEFIKYDDTKLDERVLGELLPKIQEALNVSPFATIETEKKMEVETKEENETEEIDDLPF